MERRRAAVGAGSRRVDRIEEDDRSEGFHGQAKGRDADHFGDEAVLDLRTQFRST